MDESRARQLLGVDAAATIDELKQAYRKKVRECHPDISGKSKTAIFTQIQEAYSLLLSCFRTEILDNTAAGANGREENTPLDDSIYTFLDVTSEDAFNGSSVYISVSDRDTVCPRCSGSGAVAVARSRLCSACSGSGTKTVRWGSEIIELICSKCKGSGFINPSECSLCRGSGRIRHNREVRVSLPRGIRSGTVLKLPGQGPWNSEQGRRGNLYVEVNVTMPDGWELNGMDIYAPVRIDIWTILSGKSFPVPTIDGIVMCSVEDAGIRNFREVVIKDKGWINEDGARGRHIGVLAIDFPATPPPSHVRGIIDILGSIWPAGNRPLALE